VLLLELQVRADLALQALEVVRLVGLEERGVQLGKDPLADLKDLERVVGGLAGEGRHRLEIRGKRDRHRLPVALSTPISACRGPG
jgi:hypothetical protein